MKRNNTIMQFFEWHIEPDGNQWRNIACATIIAALLLPFRPAVRRYNAPR